MRIGIDATAVSGSIVGHSSYVANLIKEMLACQKFREHEFVIYTRGKTSKKFDSKSNRIQFKNSPIKNRKICEQIWLSLHAPFDNLDLFHSTWSLPILSHKRSILTIHGLASLFYPSYFPKSYRIYWATTKKRNAIKPIRFIAISQSTKNDFIEHFNIPESKIDVVHHGVDLEFFKRTKDEKEINAVKRKYSLPRDYILFVSALIPIKNIETLIKAYNILRGDKNYKEVGLVIAGSKGWQYDNIFRLVEDLKLNKNVIFTGYFPQKDLPALYSAAKMFVLPSLYEGFGIPVVEAFACGTPVIASNTSSIPEVSGDAAILFDPKRPDAIAHTMVKVLSNETTEKDMRERGLARAKEFSWRKTAEETLESYVKTMND